MKLIKGFLTASLVASAAGLTLSLAGLASGPIILSPVTAPVMPRVATMQRGTLVQKQMLSAYRQVRTFWLSRGIVR